MGPSAEFKHGLAMAHISLTRHEPGFADLVQVHDQGGSGLPCATISVTWPAARAGQTVGGYAACSCRWGVWLKSGYQRR